MKNKKKIFDILNKKDISLEYLGLGKMNKDDKYDMYHYTLNIDEQRFDYFEGLGHDKLNKENRQEKVLNALYCIIQDGDTITFFKSIDNFMREFGYVDFIQAQSVYNKCKDTRKKLSLLFTIGELNVLRENLDI